MVTTRPPALPAHRLQRLMTARHAASVGRLTPQRVRRLLADLAARRTTPRAAYRQLRELPYALLPFARLDLHRSIRRGFPEVVYCPGKTLDHLVRITQRLYDAHGLVLLTRLEPERCASLRARLPRLQYAPAARIAWLAQRRPAARRGCVVIATGGTADLPVAEEAAVTLALMGHRVERLYDVGVAGIHRLLSRRTLLRRARVVIVVAGMDGALPSVVGGLVAVPVVAVPTSVGYGASFKGIGPLLTMLNSCAPGVAVVNIDNGFGAGYFASLINR